MRVHYHVDRADSTLYVIEVAEGATIRDLIEAVRDKQGRPDLDTCFLGEDNVNEYEEVREWAGEDAFLIKARDPAYPDIPDVPVDPPAPVAPAAPGYPDVPDAPVIPDVPDAPVIPDVRGDAGRNPDWLMATQKGAKVAAETENLVQNQMDGKLRVYATTTYNDMVLGREMDMPGDSNREAVERRIREEFRIGDDKCVLLYLSGGLLFNERCGDHDLRLDDLFGELNMSRKIYAVVVRQPPGGMDLLSNHVGEVCDCHTDEKKYLLSPIVPAADEICYTAIACLLGYLAHGGRRTDSLVKACTLVTGFAPLLCGIFNIGQFGDQVTGRTVVAVTASLHCLLSGMLPDTIPPEKIFSYLLRACAFVTHIDECKRFEGNPVQCRDHNPDGEFLDRFAATTDQPNPFAYYVCDVESEPIPLVVLRNVPPEQIENAFTAFAGFRPVGCATLHTCHQTEIVSFRRVTVLYTGTQHDGSLSLIDPRRGERRAYTMDALLNRARFGVEGYTPLLMPSEKVEEIIVVALDCSGSMKSKLDGKTALGIGLNPKGENVVGDTARFHVAWQYLSLLMNRLYGFRIPVLLGFVTFNDNVEQRCPISPVCGDIERAVKDMVDLVRGQTKLYDAIDSCIRSIGDFCRGGNYDHAKRRLLVFSDGSDHTSERRAEEVAQELVANGIILDSIHLSAKDQSKDLVKMSHASGGFAFQIKEVEDGLRLFEDEAFLILRMRPEVHPPAVTPEVWEGASEEFDEKIQNTELLTASKRPSGIYTARGFAAEKEGHVEGDKRALRLLREIKEVIRHEDNDRFRVYVNSRDINEWKLYIASPEDSHYGKQWWSLSVVFPPDYPWVPPLFRFVSDIYHVNVSEDGRICLSALFERYRTGDHVISLINAVLDMFTNPELDNATQLSRRLAFSKDDVDDAYIQQCQNSTENAKADPDQWLTGINKTAIKDAPDYNPGPDGDGEGEGERAPAPGGDIYIPPVDRGLIVENPFGGTGSILTDGDPRQLEMYLL